MSSIQLTWPIRRPHWREAINFLRFVRVIHECFVVLPVTDVTP